MKIAVIGGGVIGLTCAWRLARRGAAVTLYEARDDVGQGASNAALGALWPSNPLAKHPIQRLQRQSLWQFESFLDELNAVLPSARALSQFTRLGRVELLNSPKAQPRAQQEVAAAQAEWPPFSPGHPIMEFLSPDQIAARLPHLRPIEHGAILCRATAQLFVPGLLAALQSACERAGVTFHRRTPVTTLDSLHTDATLLTTGAWTRQLLPEIPITPAKGQAIAFARPARFNLPQIVKFGATYLIPWQNEILVGATTEPDAGFDESPTDRARNVLHQNAAALFPELASAKILRHWAGLRPDAPNHQPLMGPLPSHPNTFLCAGHYKTGIALAPLVSTLITQLILDRTTPPELLPFLPAARLTETPPPAGS